MSNNPVSSRAKKACDACRQSRKKCAYTDDSTSCALCKKRGVDCSLFTTTTTPDSAPDSYVHPTVNTQCASFMGPNSAPDSMGMTPNYSATASSVSFDQERSFYPQAEAAQHIPFEFSEQPAMNPDGLYDPNGSFGSHDFT